MKKSLIVLWSAAAVIAFATPCPAQLRDGDVSAAQYFAKDKRKFIYIEVGKGQRLVFDSNDGTKYDRGNRSLEIRAEEILVIGDVVIRSGVPTPAAKGPNGNAGGGGTPGGKGHGDGGGGVAGGEGQQGPIGSTGDTGVKPPKVKLYIHQVSGTGKITFDNSGGPGGDGGEGGKGGVGGKGGDGADRTGSDGPGNGANGGAGGIGGTGGTGGRGGDGGDIEVSPTLCPLIKKGTVLVQTTGGPGGQGGHGGPGGAGGPRGEGGGGGAQGGGGNPGSAGPTREGEHGSPGAPGEGGATGKVLCSKCNNSLCPL